MQVIVFVFAFLLASKDLLFVPAPYAIRGLTQSTALAIGIFWLARSADGAILRALAPVWAYLFLLAASAMLSSYPLFAGLQVISLGACALFFAGFACESKNLRVDGALTLSRAAMIAFSFACGASLLLLLVLPSHAFETLYGGDALGEIRRFRGAMSKSSMIACAGGLLVGLCVTVPGWRRFRLIAAALGLACLYLAQARTMWAALFLALLVVLWGYRAASRKWVLWIFIAAIAAVVIVPAQEIKNNLATGTQSVVRTEGIESLSGRVGLWKEGISAIAESPLLGYGLTLGALGLPTESLSNTRSEPTLGNLTYISRETLHNGFLQAFLDSGIVGALVYLYIVVATPIRLLRHDLARRYPYVFFVLVFMAIANLGESIIYSGAVFDSVFYWGIVVLALTVSDSAGASVRRIAKAPPNLLLGP